MAICWHIECPIAPFIRSNGDVHEPKLMPSYVSSSLFSFLTIFYELIILFVAGRRFGQKHTLIYEHKHYALPRNTIIFSYMKSRHCVRLCYLYPAMPFYVFSYFCIFHKISRFIIVLMRYTLYVYANV